MLRTLWHDYVFGKQTVTQLAATYNMDRRVVRQSLDTDTNPDKIHHPRPVHLVVDATYFGPRKEGDSWCVVVARDPVARENLLWSFEDGEDGVSTCFEGVAHLDVSCAYGATRDTQNNQTSTNRSGTSPPRTCAFTTYNG